MFFGSNYADIFFKDTPEGRVFYPYGRLGRGALVTPALEASVRAFLNGWTLIATVIIFAQIFLQMALGAEMALLCSGVAVLVLLVVYPIEIGRRLAGSTPARSRLSSADVIAGQAQAYSKSRIIFLLLMGPVLVAGCAVLFVTSLPGINQNTLLGGFGTLFFGFAFVQACRIALARRRSGQ